MREEVRSSGTAADPFAAAARSSSPPPTPVASSAGASSPAPLNNIASTDWLGGGQNSKSACGNQQHCQPSYSTNAASSAPEFSQPSCRPWERGDLLRRLATFKPFTWISKPKAANSLACARRGWINVDNEKIECESCGAHLVFTAMTSCSPDAEALVLATEAFIEQLDIGHNHSCPWRGNSCAESLVQFQFTPPSLVGGYKDRCDGLLQFVSLPVVASSAVESMQLSRSSQIDRLLSHSNPFLSGELGYRANDTTGTNIEQHFSSTYSEAQKLISLCGWEPRWLPNVQDCEENSTQSARNACSNGTEDQFHSQFSGRYRNALVVSKKDKAKGKMPIRESGCSMRSPLLDCSLCGVTVPISDFRTVSRPSHFAPTNIDAPDSGKKFVLSRGVSAGSAINGWVSAQQMERDRIEGRDEAATGEGRSLSNVGVDLNLTMGGGLPSGQSVMPSMSERFNDEGMGRDLMIGQPAGSEVGDRAASYESRGPSSRKRHLEEGGSTVDKPQDGLQHADSIEGIVVDLDGDEVDDSTQFSDPPCKRARGFELFGTYRTSRIESSGAGPSRNLLFDTDIDMNRPDPLILEGQATIGLASARDSTRASSVIAMDTVHSSEEDSIESVENLPGDVDDNQMPSSVHRNIDVNDVGGPNYSNQAQQSACLQPAAGSDAREFGGSTTNEGEEVLNTDAVVVYARDQCSIGQSGGSVGMGASHEAEIHGVDASLHRTESGVGDVEPITELTEILGNTGESAPGPGIMDEFVPEEAGRVGQDVLSLSMARADSGSKMYGSTKADSVESGEKMSFPVGHDSSLHPSLSCNAGIYSVVDISKEEVTQIGGAADNDGTFLESDYDNGTGNTGAANGEGGGEAGLGPFDPIKYHNSYCPWVNGNVVAACCNDENDSGCISSKYLSGWQLTVDALDTFHSIHHTQNQMMRSDSAASMYKIKEGFGEGKDLVVTTTSALKEEQICTTKEVGPKE